MTPKRLSKRRQAYHKLFMGDGGKLKPEAEIVLADLTRFCRLYRSITMISQTTQQTDVPASFQAEGRREVLLRMLAHLHVTDAELIRASGVIDND